jgi:hypothetical protein
MKNLRLAVIAIIAIVLVSNVLHAQNIEQAQDVDKKVEKKQSRVDEKQLDLLVGQEEPYNRIMNQHDEKMNEILDSYTDEKERDEKIKQAEQSRNKQLKEVLTEEQFNKYLELELEKKKELGEVPKKAS